MSACKCRSIFRGLRNSLGCFSHVKNIDLHYITLHYIECENADNAILPSEVDCCDFDENGIIMDDNIDIEWVQEETVM